MAKKKSDPRRHEKYLDDLEKGVAIARTMRLGLNEAGFQCAGQIPTMSVLHLEYTPKRRGRDFDPDVRLVFDHMELADGRICVSTNLLFHYRAQFGGTDALTFSWEGHKGHFVIMMRGGKIEDGDEYVAAQTVSFIKQLDIEGLDMRLKARRGARKRAVQSPAYFWRTFDRVLREYAAYRLPATS